MPQHLPGEIWGVTVWFDPVGTADGMDNLVRFSAAVRAQGLKLLIVEAAFGDAPFRIAETLGDRIVRHRARHVMWQKERLINLGVAALPESCDKVAWLDGDIVFENDNWVAETARALGEFAVVQPFASAAWLPQGATTAPADLPAGLGEGHAMPGMAAAMATAPDWRRTLADYHLHGHSGFAWAARRAIVARHGLYDRHVLGGGDVTIAHSLYGDRDYWRGLNMFCRGLTRMEIAAIADWGSRLHADVRGSVGFVPGRVLHLWHGSIAGRGYLDRGQILKDAGFDPYADVAAGPGECLAWSSVKPQLHARARAYFARRAALLAAA